MKALLAKNPLGRMLLHFGCICRGGKRCFHSAGMRRELGEVCRKMVFWKKS